MTSEHTKQLLFLAEQSSQVLQDFCKLAADYLQKGPNLKIYGAAASEMPRLKFSIDRNSDLLKYLNINKLSVEPEVIRNSVEGLINLLLESSKRRLSIEGFQEYVESLGFDNEKGQLLSKLYEIEQPKIAQALSNIGLKLPQYRNIEWRFEVEIASRSLFNQLTPVFAIDLTLNKDDTSSEEQHVLMQIDPTNLLHLTQQLEFAVQEARSQHMRKIKRTIKL